MKRHKRFSIVMVVAICVIAALNIWYLIGLYRSIRQTADMQILSAMVDMNIDETWERAHSRPLPAKARESRAICSSPEKGDTVRTVRKTPEGDTVVRRVVIAPDRSYSNQMMADMNQQVHAQIDPYVPIRLDVADSLLRKRLEERGIKVDYAYTEIVDTLGHVVRGNPHADTSCSGMETYTLVYDNASGLAYRAHISSVTRNVLDRMLGVIITNVILVGLFTVAFIYLYRLVCRLRTLEELKDDFVNNMTHELKTPVAIAYSACDALLNFDSGNDPSKKITFLNIAIRQLRRLEELVEGILAMSMQRRRSLLLNMESFDIVSVIREVADSAAMRTDKKIDIRVEADPPVILVETDKAHFANVIHNLVDNAVKYSDREVDIRIVCTPHEISVSDNGIGISSAHLPHIFNRFYRVPQGNRQDVRGYGIGLYYVSSILERMGWKITVHSKLSKGSTFSIIIP